MKKYLGILVALALVLGMFIAAPRKVSATEAVVGDFTGYDLDEDDFTYEPDGNVDLYDVFYLLNSLDFPDDYPLPAGAIGDYTGYDLDEDDFTYAPDGNIDLYDVFYLLNSLDFPDDYPLPEPASTDDFVLEEDELPPIIRVQD